MSATVNLNHNTNYNYILLNNISKLSVYLESGQQIYLLSVCSELQFVVKPAFL